jgi:GNAT superfamily N-acetyltransferase
MRFGAVTAGTRVDDEPSQAVAGVSRGSAGAKPPPALQPTREAANPAARKTGTDMLLTRELNEAIRLSEIAGICSGIATVQRLYPNASAESIEIAGGLVAFTGIDSPLSQAYGIAVSMPLAEDEIARITEFYESRGATPRIFVTPFSDSGLARGLAAAGYAPSEYENVLASDDLASHARRDERIGAATDLAAWSRASAQAFMDGAAAPSDEVIAGILSSSKGVIALEGREGAAIVATAAMDVRGECAAFFAGSTLPEHRGCGWHRAMIADRIARARDAGARLLRATARPASSSERNFLRCGFRTLYTRALWERSV